jgi:hypothetical protein
MINNLIDVTRCVPKGMELPVSCNKTGLIMPNEIAVEDNINNSLRVMHNGLLQLDSRNCQLYDYIEYYGWLGPLPENEFNCKTIYWSETDCSATNPRVVKWKDLECVGTDIDPCLSFQGHECTKKSCFGKYCTDWDWEIRSSAKAELPITWKMTRDNNEYAKIWNSEPCDGNDSSRCDDGIWNINIPLIDDYYEPVGNCSSSQKCFYTGIASRDNTLYVSRSTTFYVLSSNYTSTQLGVRYTIDNVVRFSSICGIAINSANHIYVLDNVQCKVAVYSFDVTANKPWTLLNLWGGVGTIASTNKFLKPNDIHIDNNDNVWVTDTGNNCVKCYTPASNWITTIVDSDLVSPLSVAIDEIDQVHVLTSNSIRVYDYTGNFLFKYAIDTTQIPKKINTNFNKQIIYVTYNTFVRKYVRTGIQFDYLFKDKQCVEDVNSIFQDEFRNTLVTFGDKIIKYVHILKQRATKSSLPSNFWSLEQVLIDKDEYIQDWVYNKSFQRMWDNIEIFRSTLQYDGTYCKGYKPPKYKKEELFIGQNEPVTSIVVNRNINYLWENYCSLFSYFDPTCVEPFANKVICDKPSVSWSTTFGQDSDLSEWVISSDKLKARYKMSDSCTSPITTMFGSATANITTKNCPSVLTLKINGESVQTQGVLETFTVYYQGTAVVTATAPQQAPQFNGSYICTASNANVVQHVIPKFLLQPNQTYTVIANTNTFTSLAHKNTFYEVNLSFT